MNRRAASAGRTMLPEHIGQADRFLKDRLDWIGEMQSQGNARHENG
jgi:hypothetical protein